MSDTFLSLALFRVEQESAESIPRAACNYCIIGRTSNHDLFPRLELHCCTTGGHVSPWGILPSSNVALADAGTGAF